VDSTKVSHRSAFCRRSEARRISLIEKRSRGFDFDQAPEQGGGDVLRAARRETEN
jgi:hypothetical protein